MVTANPILEFPSDEATPKVGDKLRYGGKKTINMLRATSHNGPRAVTMKL